MADKRYQVFVSSTFIDLKEERQEVIQALLELDCIPSGMELFPAANETQWELIKRVISDCDYYIVIVGGRYGSIGPEGLSYTEMEYDYATGLGKPVLAFVHANPSSIPSGKTETGDAGKVKLKAFREKAANKLCKHWDSPKDLGGVVSRSLVQLIKRSPAVGWVRADEVASSEATTEILALQKHIEELRKQLEISRTTAPVGSEKLSQGDDKFEIEYGFRGWHEATAEWAECITRTEATWNQIFYAVAPPMIDDAPDRVFRETLDNWLEARESDSLTKAGKKKGLSDIDRVEISPDVFQTIKVQLRALGLIKQSNKARSVKDTGTYWSLTPYGDQVMTQQRAIKKPLSWTDLI